MKKYLFIFYIIYIHIHIQIWQILIYYVLNMQRIECMHPVRQRNWNLCRNLEPVSWQARNSKNEGIFYDLNNIWISEKYNHSIS